MNCTSSATWASPPVWTRRQGRGTGANGSGGTTPRHRYSQTGGFTFLSEEGVTTVIAPGKEFRRLATNQLDGATLASMAVSGGSIFLRTASHLYRIGALK